MAIRVQSQVELVEDLGILKRKVGTIKTGVGCCFTQDRIELLSSVQPEVIKLYHWLSTQDGKEAVYIAKTPQAPPSWCLTWCRSSNNVCSFTMSAYKEDQQGGRKADPGEVLQP